MKYCLKWNKWSDKSFYSIFVHCVITFTEIKSVSLLSNLLSLQLVFYTVIYWFMDILSSCLKFPSISSSNKILFSHYFCVCILNTCIVDWSSLCHVFLSCLIFFLMILFYFISWLLTFLCNLTSQFLRALLLHMQSSRRSVRVSTMSGKRLTVQH